MDLKLCQSQATGQLTFPLLYAILPPQIVMNGLEWVVTAFKSVALLLFFWFPAMSHNTTSASAPTAIFP